MRPCKPRRISWLPPFHDFGPRENIQGEEVCISLDMLESLRLVDAEGLSQDQAAKEMGISTATLCRILGEARRQVASALCQGHHLTIKGGTVMFEDNLDVRRCGCGAHGRMGKRQGSSDGNVSNDNAWGGHSGCPGMGQGRGQGMHKGRMGSGGRCTGDGPCRRRQSDGTATLQPDENKEQTNQ